ncbi:MAG: N-acetyltransferase [Chloroflexi bacterium]|nr:N-acetyltransferase [Chloroflexota bacterium]
MPASSIHPSAEVSPDAKIGEGTRIWHFAQVREGATIGANCVLGKDVYVDFGVIIGSNVKIENGASIFHGSVLEDGVFVGPHACLTNDRSPRAINPDGTLKRGEDWSISPIRVCYGASIGAGAVVLPGITIGRFSLIGAGAVVTHDVGDHEVVVGNPARVIGLVCPAAHRLPSGAHSCPECGWSVPSAR